MSGRLIARECIMLVSAPLSTSNPKHETFPNTRPHVLRRNKRKAPHFCVSARRDYLVLVEKPL